MDLHVLRVQLQLLDAEAANLEHLLSASSLDGKTTLAAKPPLPNQESALQSDAALFKRAG
jgi:hypothetical protein